MLVKGGSYQEKAVTGRAAIYFGERVSRLSKQTLRPMEPEVVSRALLRLNTNSRASKEPLREGRWVGNLLQNEDEHCPVTAIGNARHSMEAAKRRTNPPANGSSSGAKLLMFRKRPRREMSQMRQLGKPRECQLLVAIT